MSLAEPKIDCHSHFYGTRTAVPRAAALDAERIRACTRFGIRLSCLPLMGSWGLRSPIYMPSVEDFRAANQEVADLQRRWSGRILGYAYVNPAHPREAMRELCRRVEEDGFMGLKLGGSRRITDKAVAPLLRRCARYRIPVLQHAGHRLPVRGSGVVLSDATDVAEAARRHPDTAFILAHIGGGGDWAWGIRAIRGLPNAYLDTSGSGCDAGTIERAVAELGERRLLFGTDLTICTGVGKIEGARIPPRARRRIYHDNMKALLDRRLR